MPIQEMVYSISYILWLLGVHIVSAELDKAEMQL